MTIKINTKEPEFLAFWTKCIRDASHWSQEALAASSGLDIRTIQRIEAGRNPANAYHKSLKTTYTAPTGQFRAKLRSIGQQSQNTNR